MDDEDEVRAQINQRLATNAVRRDRHDRMVSRASRDANALRLVGAAVTVAARASKRGPSLFGRTKTYVVPAPDMDRLLDAVRKAGFDV